jgi:glyoxylase-like metal-dependent hydrolase (beta-lactamase superfamily II)
MTSKLAVEPLAVGPLMTNCYIVWDEGTMEGTIIDPGEDADVILAKMRELGVRIDKILATHCHFDHIAAMAPLLRQIDVPFLAHEGDLFFVEDGKDSARRWGFDIEQPPNPDRFIADGEKISVGNLELEVLHTPGHSPGGVSFLHGGMVFAGDCLFQGSIGRTDFRMGSLEELSESIRKRLYTLPDDTLVMTGHGPVTTIGDEKRYNPFVRGEL